MFYLVKFLKNSSQKRFLFHLSYISISFVYPSIIAQESIFVDSEKPQEFTISGYVTELDSKELLLGVSIYSVELKLGTVSNDYGFYSLSLPKGSHVLNISYIGFSSQQVTIDLNDDMEFDIVLKPQTEELEEVVVTSASELKNSKVTQMSVVKMNPSTVEDLPALLGEKDVLKTLQLLPGISGGAEGSSGFFVRGGTPDQNLIILDDAVVYNSNHLFGFFSVFNGDAIKSVEAFKGGFPARFGGRLSSVIKIDMKDGNKEELKGKFNIGLISSSVLLEGPIKKNKTSFLLSARRTYADALARPFQNISSSGISGYHFGDLNFKINHIFDSKNKLFWSNYLGQDRFKYDFEDQFTDERTRLGWGNITSSLRWNHQFNNKWFSNTSLIFSNYKFEIKDEFRDSFSGFERDYFFSTSSGINDLTYKTDFNYYPNNTHSLRAGVMATSHNFVPQRVLINDGASEDVNKEQKLKSFEGAVYLEDDWKLSDRLRLSTGFRLSYFNFENTQYINPEPRISLAYNLKPDLAFKASYSNMNQYIHLLSSSGIGLPTDLWVSSTDEVKPQKSEQYAIGIAKDFLNKDYSLSLEGYYKTMDDVIAYKEGASFLVLDDLESGKAVDWQENITSGKGWAYGAELLLRKQKGNFTGWLGYTLAWSERQFNDLNLGRKFFDRYDRRHDISLVGIYKPNKKMTLSGSWVFATGNNFTLPNLQRLGTNGNFPINPRGLLGFSNTEEFVTARNNFRGESSHRLDLAIQFHKRLRNGNERTWGFSLYNAYARQNPFIYTLDYSDYDFTDPNATQELELKRTSVMIAIPSINYTLKF